MTESSTAASPGQVFKGRNIAVPESRQLDLFASMLEKRGATVIRCPLVAIKDAPDPAPVVAWIRRAIESPPALHVFYTGEGVDRLLGFAERAGLRADFVAALGAVRKLCRGPKPVRALRRIDLDVEVPAPQPTTAGVIEALAGLDLGAGRVCVQLYGSEPVLELTAFFEREGIEADPVHPYVYADETDDAQVLDLIERLAARGCDAIAFTSKSQVERLLKLARASELDAKLRNGLEGTCVAAVGPVVGEALAEAGIRVDASPKQNYFMKPLVSELAARIGR